jgi:hypothetical protein
VNARFYSHGGRPDYINGRSNERVSFAEPIFRGLRLVPVMNWGYAVLLGHPNSLPPLVVQAARPNCSEVDLGTTTVATQRIDQLEVEQSSDLYVAEIAYRAGAQELSSARSDSATGALPRVKTPPVSCIWHLGTMPACVGGSGRSAYLAERIARATSERKTSSSNGFARKANAPPSSAAARTGKVAVFPF